MLNKYAAEPIPDIIQNKTSKGPSAAILNVNSLCNLNCEFCWIHTPLKKDKIKPENISFASIKKIIDELKSLGTTQISLSADGEPWLNPEITAIVNYIKDNDFFLRITTNLTFNNKEILIAFARADMLDVNFSAPNEALYAKIHNPRKKVFYGQLIDNLTVYSKLYRKRKKPSLEINYVITRNNYSYLEEMLNLVDKMGIRNIRFRILDTTEYTKKLFLKRPEIISLKKITGGILAKKFKARHNLKEIDNYLGNKGEVNFDLKRCFIGWLMVSIESDGNIGLCCQHGNLTIGNWRKQSISESWYSRKANRLRQKAKDDFDINDPFWENCLFCCCEKKNKEIDSLLKRIGL